MKKEVTCILIVVTALVCAGAMTVYSVGSVKPGEETLFDRHLRSIIAGLILFLIAAKFDYHWYRGKLPLAALSVGVIVMLVAVLVFGHEIRGARRWILGFQPSEFAKLATVIFLALKLTENQAQIKTFWRGFVPPFAIAASFAGLIVLEPDLGIPAVIMGTAYLMMFVAGTRLRYLIGSLAPVIAGIAFLVIAYPYRIQRLVAFWDPWKYRLTAGFHLIQSLAAFARGSFTGLGPGAGEQKLLYLPDAHTDFIFAVWGEEMGLLGTLAVVVCFATLLIVAVRIASCAPDLFGSLLATGFASMIALQALTNIAVVTGLVPTKGLPLPFVSYGGTATLVFFAMVGILVNIGVQSEEPYQTPALAY